jgi:hypothetical protein
MVGGMCIDIGCLETARQQVFSLHRVGLEVRLGAKYTDAMLNRSHDNQTKTFA